MIMILKQQLSRNLAERVIVLITLVKYTAMTTDKDNAIVLGKELKKKTERYKHFEFKYVPLTTF